MRLLSVLLMSVAISSAAFAENNAPITKEIRCERAAPGETVVSSADEVPCLKQLAGIASRQGDVLRLKLANGAVKSFRSESQGCKGQVVWDKCVAYRLAGFDPARQMALVYTAYYEGNSWLAISRRTGNKIELPGPPHFSPSGNRLVAMACDETGERDCAMVIWSIKSEPAVQEWRHQGAFEFAAWHGDDRFAVKMVFENGKPAEAVLVNGKWELKQSAALP